MAKRTTLQRTLVLKAVRKLRSHPTADEVHAEIAREHPSISRGTVYRNLNQLAQEGEIGIREMPGCASRYDHCSTDHYHARCLHCGRIFDVQMDFIPDLANGIHDTQGFALCGYDLVFKGVCADCRAKVGCAPSGEQEQIEFNS